MGFKNIESYPEFNPKNKLDSMSFVRNNFYRLSQLFDVDDDLSLEDKEKILVDYLNRYPESIKSISLSFPQKGLYLSSPVVTNIGQIIKYK